jgi:predicted Zn finger-like uncharacterized protein
MKIVCEACQAKYSIADEKVRGKVFKIRCKKCSHVIVVRGTGEMPAVANGEIASAPSDDALAAAAPAESAWHIVVEGEQVGPLPESDIRARLVRGEVTGETYIWKEGLADWMKIASLPEFADAVQSAAYAPAPQAADFDAPVAPQASAFDAPAVASYAASAPAAFAAAAPTGGAHAEPDLFSAPTVAAPAAAAVPDLFAAPASAPASDEARTSVSTSSPFAAFDAAVAADSLGAAPRMGGNGAGPGTAGLTGQRHENSVLFSLSNLEALAKPSVAPTPSAPRPGSGPSEGSGLIDIRAMASMTLGGSSGARAPSFSGSDLPAFSAPQFSPVAPVLLPVASGSGGLPKWAIAVLVTLGVAALGLTVALIKVFTSSPQVPLAQAPGAPVAAMDPAGTVPAPAPVPTAPPTTPPPTGDEPLPPREAAKPSEPVAASRSAGSRSSSSAKKSGGKTETVSNKPAPASAPREERPAEPAKPKDDIEALLAQATGGRRTSAPAPAAAPREEEGKKENLPPLERQDINRGLSPIQSGKAKDCFNQYKVPGLVTMKITVNQRGQVTSAKAAGKFAGTPTGSCLEDAVKSAKFPASQGLTFEYPFNLR